MDNDPNDHVKILRNIVSGQFKIPGRGEKSESSRVGKIIEVASDQRWRMSRLYERRCNETKNRHGKHDPEERILNY